MIAKNAIEESTPYLRITDSVKFAVELMEEFKQERAEVVATGLYHSVRHSVLPGGLVRGQFLYFVF